MAEVTKDMIIRDVIMENPELIQTFFENGMMCIGCPASQGESIEMASMVHGIDPEGLVEALNQTLADEAAAEAGTETAETAPAEA